MPKPKHQRIKREREEHERRSDRDREESGDDPSRHASIIARRWLGSLPPTPERYARALEQWQALPGAVVRPTTSVSPAPAKEENKP